MSVVDWQIAPPRINSRLKVSPLVRLPLWATARVLGLEFKPIAGWTLRNAVSPVVEYRTWPTAACPGRPSIVAAEEK